MRIHLLLILIVLISLSQISVAKTNLPTITNNFKEQKFYKKFSGTIGNYPIVVDLIKNKKRIYGTYYYVKMGIPIQISGEEKEKNKFSLNEYDNKGELTGTFECVFVSESVIEGTWQNPKTKKLLSVKLQEAVLNYPTIQLNKNYTEDCERVKKNKLKPSNEIEYHDTLCSTLSIETAEINFKNKLVQDKINQKLLELLIGKEFKSIEDFKAVNFKSDAESGINQELICDPAMVDAKVLSFSFINYTYYFGAAHPGTYISYANFDLSTGNILKLENLLINNFKKELNAIAEKKFIKEYGNEGWDFEPGKFTITENFLISPSGLIFTFNQYEIGPYAVGSPTFVIAYKEIAHLFNEKSLLKEYYKK